MSLESMNTGPGLRKQPTIITIRVLPEWSGAERRKSQPVAGKRLMLKDPQFFRPTNPPPEC